MQKKNHSINLTNKLTGILMTRLLTPPGRVHQSRCLQLLTQGAEHVIDIHLNNNSTCVFDYMDARHHSQHFEAI